MVSSIVNIIVGSSSLVDYTGILEFLLVPNLRTGMAIQSHPTKSTLQLFLSNGLCKEDVKQH
jgi:hypothetical protein